MRKLLLLSILSLCKLQTTHTMQPQENPKGNWRLVNGTSKAANQQLIQRHKKIMNDWRALLKAVKNQNYEATRQLLENGADPTLPEERADHIWYAKSVALVELLMKYGARIPIDVLLVRCEDADYPFELIIFYLNKGFRLTQDGPWRNSLVRLTHHPMITVPPDQDYVGGLYHGIWFHQKKRYCDPASESHEAIELRLAKARLYIHQGVDIYERHGDKQQSVLHGAAKKHDFHFCRFLVDYETVSQKNFITFLLCLKTAYPRLYTQKDLLKSWWLQWTPQRLLSMKDAKGKTAYDYWSAWGVELDFLKPNT